MTIELITGTPGAGKTTYAVSQRLRQEVGRKVTLEDETCLKLGLEIGTVVERRLVVAGIRGLLLEHEKLPHILTRDKVSPIEVQKWNEYRQEVGADGKRHETEDPVHQRLAGDPPVEVPGLVQNWWLWCKPGDLIVVDECQFLIEKGSVGRTLPYWLKAMAIHRHYGVDFLLICQHPTQLEPKIRELVSMYSHVRAVMGFSLCAVYQWDHASNPERLNLATKKMWKRGASDYALFQSSAAHLSPPSTGRGILLIVPMLLVLAGGLAWMFSARFRNGPESLVTPKPASAPASRVPLNGWAGAGQVVPARLLAVSKPVPNREPYAGFGVHWLGGWSDGTRREGAFALSVDGSVVGHISLARIVRAGYSFTELAPCVGVLEWSGGERLVRCDSPVARAASPARQPASSPVAALQASMAAPLGVQDAAP